MNHYVELNSKDKDKSSYIKKTNRYILLHTYFFSQNKTDTA